MRDTARLALAVLTTSMLAAATVLPLSADASSEIPSYYSQLDFNLTSPTAWTSAAGGYANPAVYAAMPGGELEWYGAAVEDDGQSGLDRWGLFWSLRNVGFGAVHRRTPAGDGTLSVTDYRLALSVGDRASSLGVALGWSRGDTDQLGRTTVMQLGAVQRFGPYVSAGIVGTFSTERSDQSGLADLAVRPLGTDRLTVFGDVELPRGTTLDDAPWSVGAMLQVVPGISLMGRYFENESYAVALAYSFGGGLASGHVRGSATPRFDKDGNHVATTYGARIGFRERNQAAERFFRDRYYAEIDLKGGLVHTRYKYFDSRHTLYDVLAQLEAVRTDDRFAGVAVNLSGAWMSHGNAWEVREKLREVQDAGKHVVVFVDEAAMTLYHVASVADRVVMDPEGLLVLPGYVAGRTFVRGTLDKLGIGVDEWRLFTHKSAFEKYSRTEMSEADREQRQALVDEYYRTMTSEVAESREVSQSTVESWVDDVTVLLPQLALDEGAVDVLGRWDDVGDVIEDLEGSRKRMAKSKRIRPEAARRWGQTPTIAVVYALGPCAMDSGIKARQLGKTLTGLSRNRNVKAIVLRVNSPGGSAMASDVVAQALKKCTENKPVVVSQGDVAASGGYWISMYGDEILVQPTTITGSIGVIGGWLWDDGIGEKVGMTGDFVKAGKHADVFFTLRAPFGPIRLPHRALTDDERDNVLDTMNKLYDRFIDKVAEGRGMDRENVAEVAQGRVWTGVQGVDNGLADRIGGLQAAIDLAREKAGYTREDDVAIVQYGLKGLFDLGQLNPLPFLSRSNDDVEENDAGLGFLTNYDFLYLREIAKNNGRPLCLVPPDYIPLDGGSD